MIPLTKTQIETTMSDYKLSETARAFIRHWLEADPIPPVRSRVAVPGNYPCRLMGRTVYFAAHHLGLPFLQLVDFHWDSRVVLERPCLLRLTFREASGRKRAFNYCPDFFFLGEGRAELVECHFENTLLRATDPANPRAQPWRYVCVKPGSWRCPPGEEAAAEMGLGYRVFSSAEIPRTLVSNLEFLSDYAN